MIRYIFFAFLITSCTTVYQGYPLKNIENKNFAMNQTTRENVKLELGTPTFNSDEYDCYIQARGYKFLFLRFANARYNSVCFKYNKDNLLIKINNKQNQNIKFKRDDNSTFQLELGKPR